MSWETLMGYTAAYAERQKKAGAEVHMAEASTLTSDQLRHVSSAALRLQIAVGARGYTLSNGLYALSQNACGLPNKRFKPHQKQKIADEIERVLREGAPDDWTYYVRLTAILGGYTSIQNGRPAPKDIVSQIAGPFTARKQLARARGMAPGGGYWWTGAAWTMASGFILEVLGAKDMVDERIEAVALLACWLHQAGHFEAELPKGSRGTPTWVQRVHANYAALTYPTCLLDPSQRDRQTELLDSFMADVLPMVMQLPKRS